tara:strand:+ start:259 stop:438 length:180 start_codon:yes stop_codon:yes gene_type:complete
MPKKKLTKAQVKRKLKTCANALYGLTTDKIYQWNSDVPISKNVLIDLTNKFERAFKRLK